MPAQNDLRIARIIHRDLRDETGDASLMALAEIPQLCAAKFPTRQR
jgi:hypothetical protein